ncbi:MULTISPECIES: DUF4188 domain-containing protein [Actinomadura]|uniref:DUF4188 domain-containing protein n=1 Tax=Actinomadura miaoliensis TaxID=430685 RepID=A0ABP7W8D2_9ACTN
MRTTDFSRAPRQGQATAMFVGATRYRGPLSILTLSLTWFRMVRDMKRMRGYCWHKVYWEFPFTLGTLAFFEDRDALLLFARSRHHRRLMRWVTDGTKNATGGYIRIYNAEPHGYSNGVWRAEENVMAHIPEFTPLSHEEQGPPVARDGR